MNDKIKELQRRQTKINLEMGIAKDNLVSAQKEYHNKRDELAVITNELKLEIQKYNPTKLSDHAILRYFERVIGINVDAVHKEVLTDDVKALIDTLGGSGKIPNENGFSLVLKDNVVVTIVKDK